MRALAYFFLLVMLAGMVWAFPVLWELAIAGAIGGAYCFFFRVAVPDA